MFKNESMIESNLKANWDRYCTEQSSLHHGDSKCSEYTEPSVAKINTLDFKLLLVFITFIIIHVNKNLIFSQKRSWANGARYQTI